jgi:hypothetical protein
LAGKRGGKFGDEEIMHCSEDPNFCKNQISNNKNNGNNDNTNNKWDAAKNDLNNVENRKLADQNPMIANKERVLQLEIRKVIPQIII